VILLGVFLYVITMLRLNATGVTVKEPVLPPPPSEVGHENDHERLSWGERRVAWLIPYVWRSEAERQQLPYFAPLWAKTVAASRSALKVFVFYEDPGMELPFRYVVVKNTRRIKSAKQHTNMFNSREPPPNLDFVLLERGEIIERLARVLRQVPATKSQPA
jgi:hypothetical protein